MWPPLPPLPAKMDGAMILLNPGAGPVAGATVRQATSNMRTFMADLKAKWPDLKPARWGRVGPTYARENGGRAGFRVRVGRRSCVVEMPGHPLDMVKDPLRAGQILPVRLYVDGSSWFWNFALSQVAEELREGS